MASMSSLPWIPFPNSSGEASSAHAASAFAGINLGRLLRRRCADRLRLLLCSHSQMYGKLEVYKADTLLKFKNIWCTGPDLLKGHSLLETMGIALSVPYPCWISLFSGKEAGKGDYLENRGRNPQFKNIQGGNSNKRLWTNILLAINILVYMGQIGTQGKLLFWGAKVNSLIDKGQLWRFATSSLLHANVLHLVVNCYSLSSIGPVVEQLSGPKRFLAVYFTSALASSVMSYRFCQSPAVGASGAIFGLVGSFAVFLLRHKKLIGGGKDDLQHIARVIALNMVIGLGSRGIDNWGHLGGLIGGAAISWLLGPAWQYEFRSGDGRLVFTDRAPIFSITKWRNHRNK